MTLKKVENARSFIIGRFSRLYPAYWIAVILHSQSSRLAEFQLIKLVGIIP
jgi:hypothetical protein